MICWLARALAAENERDNLRAMLAQHQLQESNMIGSLRTTIELLQEQLATLRLDKDQQISKLEGLCDALRREQLRVTDDVLISFGIRRPPESMAEIERIKASALAPAKTHADRLDDDLQGLNPSDLQQYIQDAEDKMYSDEQKRELADFIAERKAAKAAKGGAGAETPAAGTPA